MCFESKGDAAERTKEQKQQGKQKSPVGKFANMEWDKQGMKDEVNSYGDDTLVNWSELARRFQIKNKTGELAQNGGQIAIEWLKSEGVNYGCRIVAKFNTHILYSIHTFYIQYTLRIFNKPFYIQY